MRKVLLLTDSPRHDIHAMLASEFDVIGRYRLDRAIEAPENDWPEVIVICVQINRERLIELIARLRTVSAASIIHVSQQPSADDRVAALDAGADDSVHPTCGAGELRARIRAALRRHPGKKPLRYLLGLGDVAIDLVERTVLRGQEAYD